MAKEKRVNEWVDFGDKIVYIYEKIFNNDKEQLIDYFSESHSLKKRNSRKKTIENWLAQKTKKPNGFYFYKFRISEYRFNNEDLLSQQAFEHWSLETFKRRIDSYLEEKKRQPIQKQMRYIYFFSTIEQKIAYFELSYPNSLDNMEVNLQACIYTSDMVYKGKIRDYNNMTYISVKNNFDYIHFIFKNNVTFYTKDLNVFGVAHCVDAPTREPKAYMVLLTSRRLDEDEKKNFSHKLNFSNLMIADEFSHNCRYEQEYFLENFSEKIHLLSRDIHQYDTNSAFSQNIYLDIVLKEYTSYIELLDKALYHNDYCIDHKRQSILFALEDMCRYQKTVATIAYCLDSEGLSIVCDKNSIMEMQLKLVRSGKLDLTYLFMIQEVNLLTDEVLKELRYLETEGIKIKIVYDAQNIYAKILLVQGRDFAIYKRKNEADENHVTKNAFTIESLHYTIELLDKYAISIDAFISEHYPLNGEWYYYRYESSGSQRVVSTVKLIMTNNTFIAQFPTKKRLGNILTNSNFTLLVLNHSVFKIQNIYLQDDLFRVSIIAKEEERYHRDVLLFGLMSRKPLTEEHISLLLEEIYEKEDEPFRVKISNAFGSVLAKFKREEY